MLISLVALLNGKLNLLTSPPPTKAPSCWPCRVLFNPFPCTKLCKSSLLSLTSVNVSMCVSVHDSLRVYLWMCLHTAGEMRWGWGRTGKSVFVITFSVIPELQEKVFLPRKNENITVHLSMISSPLFLWTFVWETCTSNQLLLFCPWSFPGANVSSAMSRKCTAAVTELGVLWASEIYPPKCFLRLGIHK